MTNKTADLSHQLALYNLLVPNRFRRRQTVARIAVQSASGRYALRRTLWHDSDAHVRAAAAQRLGASPIMAVAEVASWLRESLEDAYPVVREAALHALCRIAAGQRGRALGSAKRAAIRESVMQLLQEDSIWWVRRAAVRAVAQIEGMAALVPLQKALGDPFWRVRHAAFQALFHLGDGHPQHQTAIVAAAPALSPLGQAALLYLRARFLGNVDIHAFAPPPPPNGELFNADPAVVTARLRQRPAESIDGMDLLPLLSSPHLPLRRLALARLRARPALPVLRAALKWLNTPTQPHIAEALSAFFNQLGAPAKTLCFELLHSPLSTTAALPGAVRWAARYAADTDDVECLPALCHQLASAVFSASTRSVLLAAIGSLAPLANWPLLAEQVLLTALDDSAEPVRGAAALALSRAKDAALSAAPWKRPLADYAPRVRCALVDWARRHQDLRKLQLAAKDAHPLPRAQAILGLAALNYFEGHSASSTCTELAGLVADSDSTIRAAALPSATPEDWLQVLINDLDPLLARQALALLRKQRHHLTAAQRWHAICGVQNRPDPWLKCRLCEWLEVANPAERELLITWSRDRDLGVRAAAAARLEDDTQYTNELWARAQSLVADAQTAPSLPLYAPTAHIASSGAPTVSFAASAARRMLGGTGIAVSPLGLSGAFAPSPQALHMAIQAGVNLFFWEPRYLELTRFLRQRANASFGLRRSDMVVVAGSFEGDRVGIERDMAQALRRLNTDYIDVFLLLWVRSPERLCAEVRACLLDLKRSGRIRACGFSTHHRNLAEQAACSLPRS